MSTVEKFGQMFLAVAIFAAIFGLVLFIVDRVKGRQADRVAAVAYIAPAILLLAWGLLRPAILTVIRSFKDATGDKWVGLENYQTMFTSADQLEVLRNTFVWVLIVPFVASAIGLLYAIMVDGTRTESLAKALVFLPMAISMVGASVIWKFVYDYRPSAGNQIGLANQILVWMGLDSYQFLLNEPWNNLFLIVVMIWIQAGFAMTILSAAIKAIPDDIVEAARLDGVKALGMFRFVTLPTIRPALIVVLTTIAIATMKVFDIVRTMTGGNFGTSVVANEFYTQSFRSNDRGLGSALATLLFILVIPIVTYNVIQLRKADVR
jgi:alpha-glucoside transport system permease protein